MDVAITATLLALGAAVAMRLADPASIGAIDVVLAGEIFTFIGVLTLFGRRRDHEGRQ